MAKAARIVAVIPAHDEERFIGSVVIGARQYADAVVVVDDGSHDRTALVAKEAGALVVRLSQCQGKGAALNAGFQEARRLHPAVVVTLDGDAQHDPADIPRLAAPVLEGRADVVVGSRFLGTRDGAPAWRRGGQAALTVATNLLSGTPCTDSQSGYRAFAPAALEVLRFRTPGLGVESEMQFLMGQAGLRLAEVPITVQYQDGNKRNPVGHGIHLIDVMLGIVARRRPLAFFGLPGALLAIGGVLVGLHVVHQVEGGGTVPLGTAVLCSLLVLSGLLLGNTAVTLNTLQQFMNGVRSDVQELLRGGAASEPPPAPEAAPALHAAAAGETVRLQATPAEALRAEAEPAVPAWGRLEQG
jgi:hypothetical protein